MGDVEDDIEHEQLDVELRPQAMNEVEEDVPDEELHFESQPQAFVMDGVDIDIQHENYFPKVAATPL